MREVLDFIEHNSNLQEDEYIILGLSGGPDSMVLLNHLLILREKYKFKIVGAHVHHNLRKESDSEAELVKKYCLEHNVIFEMTKLEYNQSFSEALGHERRYAFFEQMIIKYHAKYLFTAHHGDDLMETILMRLVRGSTLKGYAGIQGVSLRSNYTIIRPLLSLTKEQILLYANQQKLAYVVDKTNENIEYTRNRYRKYILPFLKTEDPNVHQKFLQYSKILNAYDSYVQMQVNQVYDQIVQNGIIDINLLSKQHQVIKCNIINRWLYGFYHEDIVIINRKHTDSIYKILESAKPNLKLNLPKCTVIKAYNKLYIKKIIDQEKYEYVIEDKVLLPQNHFIERVKTSALTNNYVTYLNTKNLKLPLYVRNYCYGDQMTIKNMKGHKKISDIFIDEKINYQERSQYPVVIDSTGEIIWLPGIKKSAFDSPKDEKYDIILEYH